MNILRETTGESKGVVSEQWIIIYNISIHQIVDIIIIITTGYTDILETNY